MIKQHESLIQSVIKSVPRYLRDDAYQAACLGLVKAYKKKNNINKSFNAYLYRCMKNEVIEEIARLSLWCSLNKDAFLRLSEHKKNSK